MKKCIICGERPVDSPRGKYCAECREALKRKKHEEPVAFTGCDDCVHWRDCGCGMRACHLTQDTGRIRTLPYNECYRQDGTDYEKEI